MSKQTFTWQTSQVEQIAMQLYVFHVPHPTIRVFTKGKPTAQYTSR